MASAGQQQQQWGWNFGSTAYLDDDLVGDESDNEMDSPASGVPTPTFANGEKMQNITAIVGKDALLSCTVFNVGNKTVSFSKDRCPFYQKFQGPDKKS